MLPYNAVEALVVVIDCGSFQAAASKLHITQSAVSQRIALLEDQVGERLLLRSSPLQATKRGEQFIAHAKHLIEMEKSLLHGNSDLNTSNKKIRIGVNADSVEIWLFDAAKEIVNSNNYLLELVIENEEYTFERMRGGEFFSCISTNSKSLPGCEVELLARIKYKCFCTLPFKKKYFPKGLIAVENVQSAPAVLFDNKDYFHQRFLKKIGIDTSIFPHHLVPSSRGFLDIINSGMAYGVLPELQAEDSVKKGQLVNLYPEISITVPWYWHYQRRELPMEQVFRKALIKQAKKILG
jgi:LysR family transcriptional regulator (chromosome initiation inhibitor)